jgi:hypothetical protein
LAYAVTCKSCGARFSVANELVQKRIGTELALRCKRCHEPIRFTPSHPPEALPEPTHVMERPRPPLKKQAPELTASAAAPPANAVPKPAPRGPLPPARNAPRSLVALDPGLLPKPKASGHKAPKPSSVEGPEHDLFEPPPPSGPGAVDLSDAVESEPPTKRFSSAPPLFDLAHTEPEKNDSSHDIDFLLGLQGSPGTAAALQSPTFEDLTRKPESEPPVPIHVEVPAATSAPAATLPKPEPASAEKPRRRGVAAIVALSALGISGVVLAATALKPSDEAETKLTNTPALAPSAEPAAPARAVEPSAEPAESASAAPLPVQSANAPRSTVSPKPHGEKPAAEVGTHDEAPPTPTPTPRREPTPSVREPVGAAFDRDAAVSALATQATQASQCRKDGDPSGTTTVVVTFAPSGRVTSANVNGPPFAGTPTGGCIAAAFRRAHIPAFDGDKVTVSKTLTIK